MRASTAYFAGAGTVVAAIVAGVGGGLVIADMINPKPAKQGIEMTRLERRMSPEPIPAAPGPSEPVQYLAAPQPSAPAVAAAPAQTPPPTETANLPQAETGNSEPAGAKPAEAAAAPQPAATTRSAGTTTRNSSGATRRAGPGRRDRERACQGA